MRRCGICVLIIGSIALMTVSLTVQSAVTPQNPSQDLTNLEGLLGRLQAEIHRLQRPDLTERLLNAIQTKQDTGLITPSALGVSGFNQYPIQTGLTGVSGFGSVASWAFGECTYYVEGGSANRVVGSFRTASSL